MPLLLKAEGGVGALLGLAQVDRDAARWPGDRGVLVHQVRALAGAVWQQSAADQVEAQRLLVEELDRDVDAARQPARQVFFLCLDLHRVARLSDILS